MASPSRRTCTRGSFGSRSKGAALPLRRRLGRLPAAATSDSVGAVLLEPPHRCPLPLSFSPLPLSRRCRCCRPSRSRAWPSTRPSPLGTAVAAARPSQQPRTFVYEPLPARTSSSQLSNSHPHTTELTRRWRNRRARLRLRWRLHFQQRAVAVGARRRRSNERTVRGTADGWWRSGWPARGAADGWRSRRLRRLRTGRTTFSTS